MNVDRVKFASRPRPHPPAPGRGYGFTILEILLVLALMGLLVGVFVTGFVHMLDQRDKAPADEVFWQACQSAQELATLSEQEVLLRFDEKTKNFVMTTGEKTKTSLFPLTESDGTTVQFLRATTGGSAVLIGGRLVEMQQIPFVTFYPDGTCTAFRAQFQQPAGVFVLSIDPWTCAQVLNEVKP